MKSAGLLTVVCAIAIPYCCLAQADAFEDSVRMTAIDIKKSLSARQEDPIQPARVSPQAAKQESLPSLMTPPSPMPDKYKNIFPGDMTAVLSGNRKLIKSVAIQYYAHFEGLGGGSIATLKMLGARSKEPSKWKKRSYDIPAGADEYVQSGVKLVTWWREYNYWYDILFSDEFKPIFEKAINGRIETPGKKEALQEFEQLSAMVLWYQETISGEAETLIKKIDQ